MQCEPAGAVVSMDETDLAIEAWLADAPWNRAASLHGHFPALPPPPAPLGLKLSAPVQHPKWQRPLLVYKDVLRWVGRSRVRLVCGHARYMVRHTRRSVPCLECTRAAR